jgi:hypothetical protein
MFNFSAISGLPPFAVFSLIVPNASVTKSRFLPSLTNESISFAFLASTFFNYI